MKFVKILPLCVLMLGLASCEPRTSTPTSSVKPETPSSETSKPTSSEKDTETSKESSSSESSNSSTTETPVSNTKEIKPMEIYEANQDKVDPTEDKNKLLEDVTYMDVVFPKKTELRTTGGKTVTDVNGASFDSVGRIYNVKKLTFTFTANTRLYMIFANSSTSNGLLMTLKDSTGAAVKEWSYPKKESGAEPTLITDEYTATSDGQFTLETGKYINDEGVEDAKQGAATIYYMAIVSPTNA